MSKVKIIIPMGVAGAGKSVQGKLLAEAIGYRWISTGEMLRSQARPDQAERMNAGKLLDDQEIIDLVSSFLADVADDLNCVLDGFPRTIPQAEWLVSQHQSGVIDIESVVHLSVSKKTVLSRLMSRGRADDTEQVVERRYENYMLVTEPIIGWFKQHGVTVHEIDGEHEINEIQDKVLEAVRN